MTKEFLVLTAPPGAGVLTTDLVNRIADTVADTFADASSPNVLGDGKPLNLRCLKPATLWKQRWVPACKAHR